MSRRVENNCSTGTLSRIKYINYSNSVTNSLLQSETEDLEVLDEMSDIDYRYSATNSLLQSHDGILAVDEMMAGTLQEDAAIGEELDATICEEGKSVWVNAPTKLLIALLKEYFPKVGKTAKLKSKKKVWPLVSATLHEHGYSFSEGQVQSKYRSLERTYKKAKLHNSQTGRNRQQIPFQSELDELFGERRGINPEYILSNEDSGTSRSELTTEDQSSNDEVQLVSKRSPASKKRRTGTVQEDMVKKLEELHEDRKQFHETIKDYLQRKEEREKIKNDRAERKMQLLESFVLQLQNQ